MAVFPVPSVPFWMQCVFSLFHLFFLCILCLFFPFFSCINLQVLCVIFYSVYISSLQFYLYTAPFRSYYLLYQSSHVLCKPSTPSQRFFIYLLIFVVVYIRLTVSGDRAQRPTIQLSIAIFKVSARSPVFPITMKGCRAFGSLYASV